MPRMPRTHTYAHQNFFRQLPPVSCAFFFLGVFLLFAPLPLIIASDIGPERGVGITMFWLIYSGLIAVAWATSRTVWKPMLPVAIALTLGISLSWAFRWPRALAMPMAVPGIDGVGIVLILIAAYVVFVVFISGEGVRTLRMQAELSLARQIHETLAPQINLKRDRLEALARSDSSAEMGGDLIDFVEREDGGLDLYLADVSGHGVKAGVVMAMVKSAIRMRLLRTRADADSLGDLLTDLNRVVCQVGSPEMFVTFACMRVNREARSVEYAIAGHPPILRFSADGGLQSLDNAHMPLGIDADEAYTSARIDCAPGDTFVLYTDGLTEATDGAGRQLGQKGFEQIATSHAREELGRMFEAVFADVRRHSGRLAQADDQTLLLARVS